MPRLLLFAACEKVIIDQDNNISLVSILQDVKAEIPAPAEIPPGAKAVAAMKWAALSMWLRTDADQDKEYQQRIALVDPSGNLTGVEARMSVAFGDKTSMRNIANILGFPIYESGRYWLRLWMHEKGQPESAEPIAEYPVNVLHEQPKD